jgi:hypothetical protein
MSTVGLKHFFAFTASTPAKSGFLQGRPHSALGNGVFSLCFAMGKLLKNQGMTCKHF